MALVLKTGFYQTDWNPSAAELYCAVLCREARAQQSLTALCRPCHYSQKLIAILSVHLQTESMDSTGRLYW